MFKGKEEDALLIWEHGRNFLVEFRLHNLSNSPLILKPVQIFKWEKKTPFDFIKINVDAAWDKNSMGIKVLARDNEGFLLGGRLQYIDFLASTTWAKIEAINEGISWACSKH